MKYSRFVHLFVATFAAAGIVAAAAAPVAAQRRGGSADSGRRAAPRTAPAPSGRPPIVGRVVPYRPYYYPSWPRVTFGFGYYGYYPYSYYYPYGYYAPYGYYEPYGWAPPVGYVGARPGGPYGSVRVEGAPRDAQVFVDGYYVGVADDFDGHFQHLDLPAGVHQIEVRAPGAPSSAVEVRVEPGQTITYHASPAPRP